MQVSHNVRPGEAFAGQKLKFTGHLSDDRLLFAALIAQNKPTEATELAKQMLTNV